MGTFTSRSDILIGIECAWSARNSKNSRAAIQYVFNKVRNLVLFSWHETSLKDKFVPYEAQRDLWPQRICSYVIHLHACWVQAKCYM